MTTLRSQRDIFEGLLEDVKAASETIDDANCMVNESLRTIRALLRKEIGTLTGLIEEEEGLPSDKELAQLVDNGEIG